MEKTIFKKIIDGELSCNKVYEDDLVLAFHDINPQAPTHILVIPKKEIADMSAITSEDVELCGHLLLVAGKIAEQAGIAKSGYRCVFNCGPDSGMEIPHLHLHLLGGRAMTWPPG